MALLCSDIFSHFDELQHLTGRWTEGHSIYRASIASRSKNCMGQSATPSRWPSGAGTDDIVCFGSDVTLL